MAPPTSPKDTATMEERKTSHDRRLSERKRRKILRRGDILEGVQ